MGGALGPSLHGLAQRSTPAQARERIADARRLNPQTIMPAYLSTEGLHNVAQRYRGQTVLTPLALDDIVSYLFAKPDAVLQAIGRHGKLQKLTIMRPEGMGEPIRKAQCAVLAQVMVQCASLFSLHLRRAGMWTDTLAALATGGAQSAASTVAGGTRRKRTCTCPRTRSSATSKARRGGGHDEIGRAHV